MSVPTIDYEAAIPLFPLPNVVLFPGVVQPLHIFEPRYREMMAWTLTRQKLIAMALLKPGWEKNYYGRPTIFETVCVGRIIAHEMLRDGKYNLLLQGAARARVAGERREGTFRVATLEPVLIPEPDPARDGEQRAALARQVTRGPLARLPIAKTLRELFEQDASTSLLLDALASAAVSDVMAQQRLLETASPSCRAEMLLKALAQVPAEAWDDQEREWPPKPSAN